MSQTYTQGLANFRNKSLKEVGGIISHKKDFVQSRELTRGSALSSIKIMIDRVVGACNVTSPVSSGE